MPEPQTIPQLTHAEFAELAARQDPLRDHPCVITDLVPRWRAFTRWRDLGVLRELFGHITVTAGAPQFASHEGARVCKVETTYGVYLDYLKDADRVEELFDGCWVEGDLELYRELGLPLYCGSVPFARLPDDRTLDGVDPLMPDGIESWNDLLPGFYRAYIHFWLYVSNAGALTPLHRDNNAVCAYLGQIKGAKKAILYSDADTHHLCHPDHGWFDPLDPDDERFPTWREAQPWEATLEPGQMLVWGGNWSHHVRTLEDSITLSHDWINATNIDAFLGGGAWFEDLGAMARPALESRHTWADLSQTDLDLGRTVGRRMLANTLAAMASDDPRREVARSILSRIDSLGGPPSSGP